MDDTPPQDTLDSAAQPDLEQTDEVSPDQQPEPSKFSEAEINSLIDTYQLFIKKKQPNSVCLFTFTALSLFRSQSKMQLLR